jgi:AraC-like DNA-binding protein
MIALRYREWRPPERMRGAVACIWARVALPREGEALLVLPDGCVDLMWQRGRGAFVAGPDTGPMPTVLEPGALIVGARFLPGAGGPALAVPLSELRDERVDVAELDRDLARRLSAGLSPTVALARIGELAAELVTARPPDPIVREASARLARPRTRLSDVERDVGLGERQLRRRFELAVGFGPKTLQRVLRFRRFLALLDATGTRPDLARLSLDSGYSDQAHLTREAARLAGLSPAVLARRARDS